MIKELIKDRPTKNSVLIVLLALLFLTGWVAMILIISRKVRLRTKPAHPGWGFLIFVIGILSFVTYVNYSTFFIVMLAAPAIINGLLILGSKGEHDKHVYAADVLLGKLMEGQTVFGKEGLTFQYRGKPGVKFAKLPFLNLLKDLQENGIIAFTDSGNSYTVHLIVSGLGKPVQAEAQHDRSWNCRNCGAPGNTGSKCEYCGTAV